MAKTIPNLPPEISLIGHNTMKITSQAQKVFSSASQLSRRVAEVALQITTKVQSLWKPQYLIIGFFMNSVVMLFLFGFLIVSNVLWAGTQDELNLFTFDLERRLQTCEIGQAQIMRKQTQLEATLMSLRVAIRQRNKDLPIK